MKKFITLTLAAVLLVAALCAAHKSFRTYPHTALVTALDEKTGTVTVTDSSGDTRILPLVVPDGAARISTAHLWLQLLRAL